MNVKLVSAYLHVLLVINAHDIELNPGPYKPKFPCQMCSKAVKWGQRGVRCDSCLGWYHTECMGMGTHTYEDLDGSRVLWICHSCGIPNYSACHMFTNSSIETYNSFSSLDTVNDENELLLSPPAGSLTFLQNVLRGLLSMENIPSGFMLNLVSRRVPSWAHCYFWSIWMISLTTSHLKFACSQTTAYCTVLLPTTLTLNTYRLT